MRRFLTLATALMVVWLVTAPVRTQTQPPPQQVLPPEARYWMGVTTGAGIQAMGAMSRGGQPSMADMMRMGMGGGPPSESHLVELRLGTSLPAGPPGPEAFHTMPPGAQVNRPIFLQTPQGGASGGDVSGYRQPKGQISFYWGCGEKAAPGQPVVLTFDKLMRGESDAELSALEGAVSARQVRKPSPGNSKTYGDWPHGDTQKRNKDLKATFPTGSTLAGPHVIEATYSPRIAFTLPDGKSYLDAVRYTSTAALKSGSVKVSWASVNRATGYALGVMAPEKVGDDSANLVMWSSANRPATFLAMEDLTPAEVARLIKLDAVLPPSTTDCAVPAEVVKATKMGSMLMFTAFGDEATYIHPPRPENPAIPWDQEWFARVSFKSTRMDMITPEGVQDLMGNNPATSTGTTSAAAAAPPPPDASLSDEEYCKALEAQKKAQAPPTGGGLRGRLMGRMMGGRKDEPLDPRCVKK